MDFVKRSLYSCPVECPGLQEVGFQCTGCYRCSYVDGITDSEWIESRKVYFVITERNETIRWSGTSMVVEICESCCEDFCLEMYTSIFIDANDIKANQCLVLFLSGNLPKDILGVIKLFYVLVSIRQRIKSIPKFKAGAYFKVRPS